MIDISVKNLTKFFVIGENLLEDLSFEVQEGECVAILGRNGCGKTTLFNILTGQMDYDEGTVFVNPNKRLGLISQIPRFPVGYTVEDVLRSAFLPLMRIRSKMQSLEYAMAEGATPEQLKEVLGELTVDKAVLGQIAGDAVVRAPGMKYIHYAPKGDVIILSGAAEAAAAYAKAHAGENVAILCYEEELPLYAGMNTVTYGHEHDPDSLAHGLFSALRELDDAGYATIFARCPDDGGVGYAVQNRLKKAAGFRILEV